MGKLETETKKRRRKENIQGAILGIIAGAGIIAVAAVAFPLLAGVAGIAKQAGYRVRYRAQTAAGRLADKGLIRFVTRGGKKYIEITDAGRRAFEIEKGIAALKAQHPRRWDRRYRLVMFDIPHERRRDRDHLRTTLRSCGFLRLQNSVWLYPFDCEDLVTLLKSDMRIGKDVLYAIVETLENDKWIRNHFDLPHT